MQSVRSNGEYLKICSSLPEQRKGIFDLVILIVAANHKTTTKADVLKKITGLLK